MKTCFFVIVLVGFMTSSCQQGNDHPAEIVYLPITMKPGFGPFNPGFGFLTPYRTDDKLWGKTYPAVKGKPTNWSGVKTCMVWLNTFQLVYQNYRAGTISPENYKLLQRDWEWKPDTTKLSAKPIKCYVCVLRGYDETAGKWAVRIDQNNNLDFSDDKTVYPELVDNNDQTYVYKNIHDVNYEVYQQGTIKSVHVPMIVIIGNGDLSYCFPQYASATLRQGDKSYTILITSKFFRPSFGTASLTKLDSKKVNGKIYEKELVKIGEMIEIGNVTYINKGVDEYHNWLILDPVDITGKEYSLQVGHPFRPFSATEFTSGKPIASVNYKNKYVFIDFWGTWCKGCVEDIPSLKKAYDSADTTKVEFVSIACHDSRESLASFIKKTKLAWPQVYADDKNKLADLYSVKGYPTSVLINPQGMIIARDLRGKGLQDALDKIQKN